MKGKIVAGALAPHPPHLVYAENPPQNEPKSECGWENLRWAYERMRKEFDELDFDCILVHSPHWQTHVGHHILAVPEMKGLSVDPVFPNLFRFHYDLKVDVDLAHALDKGFKENGLDSHLMTNPDFRVDYGTIISCHLVRPQWDKPIISLSANMAYFDYSNDVGQKELTKLGQATKKAIEDSGKKVLLLASCSLSHRHFTEEPPIPEDMSHEHIYHHGQYLWDMKVLKMMKEGNCKDLMEISSDFIDQSVSETKFGCMTWLLSALDIPNYPANVHGYGTVIGTGNAVVSWIPEKGASR